MTEDRRRSGAALNALASESYVSVVVRVPGTCRDEVHVFDVAGAELAEFLGTWCQSGGWSSIRIEPKKKDGPLGVFAEP